MNWWSLQTDYNSTPGHVSSPWCPREGWSQSLRLLLRGEGRPARPLGPVLALMSGGPALSRSQDEGQTVEVVSLYKEAAGTRRDLGGLLGQHGLLHGLLQRLPRHQQAHHLLRALGEPLPGLVVCDHGHVPAVHLHDLVSNL